MKPIITILALVVSCVLPSCSTRPSAPDIQISLLFDMTDKVVAAFPSADEFISQLNLKEQPYQSICVRISTISDKDLNSATVLSLEKEDEWASNITIRRAKIQHFAKQLQQCLSAIQGADTSCHSIIYRAVAAQANRLAASPAKRKYLIVYSNLYENSDINFYNPGTLRVLQNNPNIIQQRLEQEVALHSLNGLDTWLIYNAISYRDNNHFKPIVALYQRILQAHGSTVHVDTKFQPL